MRRLRGFCGKRFAKGNDKAFNERS